MAEYRVTKRYLDVDEDAGFYIDKLYDPNNDDITSLVDTNINFEDDNDLAEFLAEVFDHDPDDIDIIEEEVLVEYTGDNKYERLDSDRAGIIKE